MFNTDRSCSHVYEIGRWVRLKALALCCALGAGIRWEPSSWTELCEMCTAETQNRMQLMLHTWNWAVLSKRIPLSGMYLAPVLRKLGWNHENYKLPFFFSLLGNCWNLGNTNPLREKPEKRLWLFSCTLVPPSSWCLARMHFEKFNKSLNEGTQLSFFLYNEIRCISVWHQRELFNNDVLYTNERLCPRGRWLWCW